LFVVLAIKETMKKEYVRWTIIVLLQCGEFDHKIKILHGKMVVKIINVLCPFLGFVETFFLVTWLFWCWIHVSRTWITLVGINYHTNVTIWWFDYDDLVENCYGFFESRLNYKPKSSSTWTTNLIWIAWVSSFNSRGY
jgi:hypothetical protein